ncbi:hypothetical protein DW682_06650 [Collinsella intestinalis]|uniref:Uncharacterized protein n=1 Tax=Collinsella intestinalis TaxID=147207 RepID=A0A414NEA5_9ACTN|nr:hypothetical protein DW682_06650 [Collinsella intestinalis]
MRIPGAFFSVLEMQPKSQLEQQPKSQNRVLERDFGCISAMWGAAEQYEGSRATRGRPSNTKAADGGKGSRLKAFASGPRLIPLPQRGLLA